MTVLDRILEVKQREVRELRPRARELMARARDATPPRGFARALQDGEPPAVIAEFKRASPSKGWIREGADPANIAKLYAEAGAAALSVLTDREFFRGGLEDLEAARAAVSLPALRKDFTIDALQIIEARAHGADAVLLIVAALDDARIRELLQVASEHHMDALVEVHTADELARARTLGATLVGVNNRDLHTFVTDVGRTRTLLPQAGGLTLVSESGLDDPATIADLRREGVAAFLIGEALMREPDPAAALRRLRTQG